MLTQNLGYSPFSSALVSFVCSLCVPRPSDCEERVRACSMATSSSSSSSSSATRKSYQLFNNAALQLARNLFTNSIDLTKPPPAKFAFRCVARERRDGLSIFFSMLAHSLIVFVAVVVSAWYIARRRRAKERS